MFHIQAFQMVSEHSFLLIFLDNLQQSTGLLRRFVGVEIDERV